MKNKNMISELLKTVNGGVYRILFLVITVTVAENLNAQSVDVVVRDNGVERQESIDLPKSMTKWQYLHVAPQKRRKTNVALTTK